MRKRNVHRFPDTPIPKNKYLVFSSVGDTNALSYWKQGKKNFDVWVAYYGNTSLEHKDFIDFSFKCKGGKFPNLQRIIKKHENVLKQYNTIAILDDDLVMSGTDISRLFFLREAYAFWILQPAFSDLGKISHPITKSNPRTLLRSTNFVEVTCPFFKTEKLLNFMKIYKPELICFGVDWWFLNHLAPPKEKVAIIDAITCINPLDKNKPEGREINKLQSDEQRQKIWKNFKNKHNIQESHFRQYTSVPNNNKRGWLSWIDANLKN